MATVKSKWPKILYLRNHQNPLRATANQTTTILFPHLKCSVFANMQQKSRIQPLKQSQNSRCKKPLSVKTHLSYCCELNVKTFCCSLGTTEKIFESKLEVYDVYVDNQNIKCKPHLSWIAHFNNADRDRLEQLDTFR